MHHKRLSYTFPLKLEFYCFAPVNKNCVANCLSSTKSSPLDIKFQTSHLPRRPGLKRPTTPALMAFHVCRISLSSYLFSVLFSSSFFFFLVNFTRELERLHCRLSCYRSTSDVANSSLLNGSPSASTGSRCSCFPLRLCPSCHRVRGWPQQLTSEVLP